MLMRILTVKGGTGELVFVGCQPEPYPSDALYDAAKEHLAIIGDIESNDEFRCEEHYYEI